MMATTPLLAITSPLAAAAFSFITIHTILRRRQKKRRRRPRWWTKELFTKRDQYGIRLMRDMAYEAVEDTVKNFVRMTTMQFEHLAEMIAPKVEKINTRLREAISVKERLAITLRFLATGDSYSSLQYQFRVSKQIISRVVPEVCDAIIAALQDYVQIPTTQDEWLLVSKEFEDKWSFPHAIAAMDGKHVMLQAPFNSGTDYYNYKNFFSIVLFALVDANYNFMYVDVGCQGRISDGGVFKNSKLYKKLEKKALNIPEPCALRVPYSITVPYMILGDKAFALNEYTMKPFEGNPQVGSIERIFNYRHSRARRVVENAFGILSAVFRVLRKPILLEPEKATKVVLATIYLHNFLRKHNTSQQTYTPPGTFDSENEGNLIRGRWRNEQQMTSLLPIRNVPRRPPEQAKYIRLHLASHFVLNDVLPWQNNY